MTAREDVSLDFRRIDFYLFMFLSVKACLHLTILGEVQCVIKANWCYNSKLYLVKYKAQERPAVIWMYLNWLGRD